MTIEADIQAHIDDLNNPHEVNKTDVGLGNVINHPVATIQEGLDGTPAQRYVTPAKLKDVFDGVLMRAGYMDSNRNVILPLPPE